MYQYFIGVAVGIGAGIAIGFYIGSGRKRWSALTSKEKKGSIFIIVTGGVLLMVGVVVLINMLLL
jgi:hypothetical protein